MKIHCRLNNSLVTFEADADERLLTVLRRDFQLSTVKKSCMQGVCGACMVLLDNQPVCSCMVPVFTVEGRDVITLEYFETTSEYKTIMYAFEQQGINLCGFCAAGIVFTAYHLLQKNRPLTHEHIYDAYVGALCNCTTVENISSALKRLSTERKRKVYG
ncbi:MAG: (2Fe-2S)-binding protein [Treponema sp.]